MSTRSYVALIADATASRALAPARRARLQTDVRAVLKELNRRFARTRAGRFAVTLGDELQCLLATAAPGCGSAHHIPSRLAPLGWEATCCRRASTTPLA